MHRDPVGEDRRRYDVAVGWTLGVVVRGLPRRIVLVDVHELVLLA